MSEIKAKYNIGLKAEAKARRSTIRLRAIL